MVKKRPERTKSRVNISKASISIGKKPTSQEKSFKYKAMIKLLTSHSTLLEELRTYFPNHPLTTKEIHEYAITTLERMYLKKMNRYTIPTAYLYFESPQKELQLNLLMKRGVVQFERDRELLKQHGITQECSINMRIVKDTVPLYDWAYMGLYECEGNAEDINENGQKRAMKAVKHYVKQRNSVMTRVKKIYETHKVKVMLFEQLDYEMLMHMSNYFRLMFKFLTKQQLQSDEASYKGTYYENWFETDLEIVKKNIERSEEYIATRKEWRLNDGWILVPDELKLNYYVSNFCSF